MQSQQATGCITRSAPASFEKLRKPQTTWSSRQPKWRHNVRHGLANGNARQPLIPRLVNSRCKRRHAGDSGCAVTAPSRPVVERAGDWSAVWQDGSCGMWCASPFWQAFLSALLSVVPADVATRSIAGASRVGWRCCVCAQMTLILRCWLLFRHS